MWDLLKPNQRLESLDYADDKFKFSHRLCDMQQKLNNLTSVSNKVGLKINTAATKELIINSTSTDPLNLLSTSVERVEKFAYLGSCIFENDDDKEDIGSRIRKALGEFTQLPNA